MAYLNLKTIEIPSSSLSPEVCRPEIAYHVEEDKLAYTPASRTRSDGAFLDSKVTDLEYKELEDILTELGIKSIVRMEALEEKKRLTKKLHHYSGISTHLT